MAARSSTSWLKGAWASDYIIAHGVPQDELAAKGYGKTRPIADNRTAKGRARNRRVVLVVLDNPSGVKVRQNGGEP